MTKHDLKLWVEKNETLTGKVFGLVVQFFILVSIVSFSMSTVPDLSPRTQLLLSRIEIATVALFSVEYLLRVYVADCKRDYILSFFGLVDLLAILPFYIQLGIDTRSIRILRMLRLFRIFKLGRYNLAMRRFAKAFRLAREEFVLFGMVTLMLLYLSAVGMYYFEHDAQPEHFTSVFDSLWWAVATLTTVGYGDVYPITVGGKIFTFIVLMLGLGIVAIPAGLLASALATIREQEKAAGNSTGEGRRD